MALLVAHTLGEDQAHLAAPDKGEAMRPGKLLAVIFPDWIDLYLLSNGRIPQYLGLFRDLSRLSRIDIWEDQFHLITKTGNCIWVDKIQKGDSDRGKR